MTYTAHMRFAFTAQPVAAAWWWNNSISRLSD